MTVVSGLGNKPAESSAVHAIVPATWLSCEHPRQSHAPFGGVTVDQIAARHIGQETPLPSLELATEEEGGGAACDGTYGCSYGRTISFRTPTTPMPMEFEPRKAFEKIFGRGKSDAERRAVSGDYQSLLDMVLAEANALKGSLGGEDRALVDDYLDSVREIERRLELLGQRDLTKIDLPDVPVARPSFDDLIRLQFDLIVAAFQANMTRIASFMMAAEVSNQSYAHVGVPDAFHPVSHHADNKASMEKLVLIQRYHTQVFADFMTKLEQDSRRRRRLDPRQLDLPVRQQHEQQQPAQPVPVADARVRRRRRRDQGQSAPRVPRSHAAREPAVHAVAARRRARRQGRRQHRRARRGLARCRRAEGWCWS